jgi:hypothetical protein
MPKESQPTPKKESANVGERASRFLRDINLLGAAALAGVAVIAPPVLAPAAGVWAGVNAVQAGGFEVARRHFAKKRKKSK